MSPAPILLVGSASIHVARMARGLCEAGQPVVLATHGGLAMAPHPLLRHQARLDLSVHRLDTPWRLRRLMRRWSVRAVHAHQANSVGWHAARAVHGSSVPLLLTLWGSDVLSLPGRSAFHGWMVRRALQGAQAWTADAQVLLAAAHRIAGDGPLREWIPLGIDEPPALPGVAAGRRILSCRLHKPLYRIDAILQAFARLPERCRDWTLEVAAAGPQTDALRRLADILGIAGRVEFSGMLDAQSLARSYRRAAVFASVPESDGTSVSLLEAMAAGCVPVLSDLPANREWVTEGHNGFLVSDLARLDDVLLRAIDTWETGVWRREGLPFNQQLIREKALFAGNIRQFIALYDRLEGPLP